MADDYCEKLYPICSKMQELGYQIIDQVPLLPTRRGFGEPKLLALSLFCRTLRNFEGVIVLTRQGLAVEARVLARCCFENMFVIGGLLKEGEEFANRMIEDDAAGRKGRIRFALETE